ncbi:MAG: hypothetical protein Q8S22_05990 [Eubacteriales bacterium]|nr:hypothetical protein [Eubacteriales bacterium]
MRPNSLFFDRGGKQGLARTVSMLITIAYLVLIGYILIRYKRFTYLFDEAFFTTPMFGWLLLSYIALAVLFVFILRWANCRVRRRPALWAVAVFAVAMVPRAFLVIQLNPAYLTQGWIGAFAALLRQDAIPLVLSAVSALSAAVVYLIARRFDEGSAPAAGLLFALYPANIVLAQRQCVMQAVVLFALLSVLFALVAFSALRRGRAMAFSALSGLSFALCGVALASVWLLALAFGVFWLVLFLASFRIEKEPLRLLLIALAFCAVFFSLRALAFEMPAWGSIDANLSEVMQKNAAQQAREGVALLDSLNWENLQQGYDLQGNPVRLDHNIVRLWLEKDGALLAATNTAAFSAAGLSNLMQGVRLLDFFYIAGIFLFAWIGGLLRRSGGAGDLLLWVFLVWALSHLLSDRQMITRALGVPILMMFAANGVFAIVGTEPRPKERSKYAYCVNRGALNLGDIPPAGMQQDRSDGVFSVTKADAGARPAASGGLYAAMEADISQRREQDHTTRGDMI